MSRGALDLRDARIDSIDAEEGGLALSCAAFVDGRLHEAVIRVFDGECDRDDLEFPILIERGALVIDGESRETVPCPLQAEGEVALMLEPADSAEFTVRGSGIETELGALQDE
jgi:hypothetical protein